VFIRVLFLDLLQCGEVRQCQGVQGNVIEID
jgi:hypothetical protein